MIERKEYLKDVKKIVVKIGTTSITHSNGLLNLQMIDKIARQLSDLHNKGYEVVLVSSGALGAGMGKLKLKERPRTLPEKQATAAIGQGVLIHMYEKFFSEYGKTIGQMLLTNDDFSDRQRFLNSRNTCFSILNYDVIPILNENDATTVNEIKVGDNDTLSALVVSLIDADLLIILSDIDGLYDSNPSENKDANLISIVPEINSKIKQMSGKSNSKFGTGGMDTKIKCAEIATTTGADMIIAKSDMDHVITRILEGEKIGTLFMKKDKNITSRKHWIGYSSKISGKLIIDSGAVKAIYNKKSLLPSGIIKVEGDFSHSDTVSIAGENGEIYANGITYYSSSEIEKILGKPSSKIEKLLGYKDFDEVIHVNNLVIIKEL